MTDEEEFEEWDKKQSFRIPPCGIIQLKGTDICISVTCTCGAISHFDGEHLHFVQCGSCGQLYMTGTTIVMHKVPQHLSTHVQSRWDVHSDGNWFQGPNVPDI